MSEDPNPLDRLLNRGIDDAPVTEEEVQERLSALDQRHGQGEQDEPSPPGEQRDEPSERAEPPRSQPEPGAAKAARPQAKAAGKSPTPSTPPASAVQSNLPTAQPGPLQEIQEFVSDIQELSAIFAGAVDESASYSAMDSSGVVRATINGSGELTELTIRPTWKRSVGLDGLEAAVLQALSKAGQDRLEGWAASLDEQKPPPAATAKPQLDAFGLPTGPRADVDRTSLMRLANELFDEFEDRSRAAEEAIREESGRGRRIEAPGGRVTVTVSGGVVTGLAIDRDWLERATDSRLCAEIKAAVKHASEADEPPAMTSMKSTMNEITELVQLMMRSIK